MCNYEDQKKFMDEMIALELAIRSNLTTLKHVIQKDETMCDKTEKTFRRAGKHLMEALCYFSVEVKLHERMRELAIAGEDPPTSSDMLDILEEEFSTTVLDIVAHMKAQENIGEHLNKLLGS